MREPFTQLYVHLVWATWDRLPLVTPDVESSLYAAVAEKCRELKCAPLAIGGERDHLHVLAQLDPAVSVALLVKEVKGSSSHLMTHEVTPGEFFKWQGAYRAFTIRKDDVPVVAAYVRKQKEHHAAGSLLPEWEQAAPERE